jgi:hypothetical protein
LFFVALVSSLARAPFSLSSLSPPPPLPSLPPFLSQYLSRHPLVQRVNYAGLPSHPGYAVHMRQATNGGSLLSFTTGNVEASKVRELAALIVLVSFLPPS